VAIVFCYGLGLLLWLGLAGRRWAYRAAFLMVVATLVGLPLAGAGGVGGAVGGWIAAVSPVSAFASITSGGTSWLSQLGAAVPSYGACVGIVTGLALCLLVLDARLLEARLRHRSRGAASEPSATVAVTRERPSLLERYAERWDSPVIAAACRGMARTGAHLVVIVLLALGLLVCVGLALSSGVSTGATPVLAKEWTGPSEPLGWRLLQLCAAGGGLLAAIAMGLSGASAFGEERRRQTFGFVLLTPLTDREILEGRWVANALPVGVAYIICIAVSAVGVVLHPSALSVTQWVFNAAWGALVAAAAGYMGLAGSLGRTVSEGNAALSTFVVLGIAEGIGLGVAAISRSVCGAYPSVAPWIASMFALALLGVALLFVTAGRSAALAALRSLRASDPFTT
jgi:hypothetical protein